MKTELFLALRYLRPRRNAVSIITLISIIGVMLGVAVLVVVLAVMTGFTDTMKDKLLQTQAHLHVSGNQSLLRNLDVLSQKMAEAGCRNSAAVIMNPALVQYDRRFEPKMIFGVNAAEIRDAMDLDNALREGSFDMEPGEAVIGIRLARQYNLEIGDPLILHSPNKLAELVKVSPSGQVELNRTDEVFLPTELTVAGIASFGKYDFDRDMIFVNITDAADLFNYPWGSATTLYGWVDNPLDIDRTVDLLEQSFPMPWFRVESWKQLNAQLLGVLQVEKNMMFFLLIFIVLVAAFSIANTLITSVYQKTREIGVIKALGGSDFQVMNIFVFQGFLVGLIGSALGFTLGWTVILLRNDIMQLVSKITGQPLFPAELYFFNELPAHIVASDVWIILGSSIALCTLGGLIPAFRAARLDPAKSLRYE